MGNSNLVSARKNSNRCSASAQYELQRAAAKLEAAARHLDRAFAASEDGLRPIIAVTRGEALSVMDHARVVLQQAA